MRAVRVPESVLTAGWIEVSARGHEVRWITAADLVNMDSVRTWREVAHERCHADTAGLLGERGDAGNLSGAIT